MLFKRTVGLAMPRSYSCVTLYHPVFYGDDAICEFCCLCFVRHEYDGAPFAAQLLEYLHHLKARVRIEIAGRFIGKNDVGVIHERAGYRDALLLPAGEPRHLGVQLFRKADAL